MGILVRNAASFLDRSELSTSIDNVYSSLTGVHRHSVHIAIKGNFQFTESLRLHLTCVLEFADPVSLLFLEATHLRLNLNSFVIFLMDLPDNVKALLSALQCFFLRTQLQLLLFLSPDHVLHRLSF